MFMILFTTFEWDLSPDSDEIFGFILEVFISGSRVLNPDRHNPSMLVKQIDNCNSLERNASTFSNSETIKNITHRNGAKRIGRISKVTKISQFFLGENASVQSWFHHNSRTGVLSTTSTGTSNPPT